MRIPAVTDILVIEDDRDLRTTLEILLQEEGYRVKAVHDGREALRQLQTDVPRVILLDLSMPGLDGRGFLRATCQMERLRDIPVVVMSAIAQQVKGLDDPRIVAHLLKPMRHTTLLDVLGPFGPQPQAR